MDELSTAYVFSTIVSLIGQFRSEQSGSKQSDFNEFLTWLTTTQHEELKDFLETNSRALIGIKSLLKEDRNEILSKLQSLDNALSSFASGLSGFSEIAEAINPESKLSKQAISILCQIDESGGSEILEANYIGGSKLHVMDGDGGVIDITEPRFVEDDLISLVELKLLRHTNNSTGNNVYIYTRAAARLVNSMAGASAS